MPLIHFSLRTRDAIWDLTERQVLTAQAIASPIDKGPFNNVVNQSFLVSKCVSRSFFSAIGSIMNAMKNDCLAHLSAPQR
jgi:hypothetical protein